MKENRKDLLRFANVLEKWSEIVIGFLYPSRCALCGRLIESENDGVCDECYERLPFINDTRCIRCSKSIEENELLCTDCSKIEHCYTQGFAMWKYDKTTKKIISRLKYDGVRDLSLFISRELAYRSRNMIKKWTPDAIIPVPLHPSKKRRRGFNQAALIAGGVGKTYGIPVVDDVLFRSHKTLAQKHLDNTDRMSNLKGAFYVDAGKLAKYRKQRSVVVVDDIYTTGSTIDGCANALLECGVEKVYFLCACIGMGF